MIDDDEFDPAQSYADWQQHAEQQMALEMEKEKKVSNVVHLPLKHTDEELIPLQPKDVLFSKFIFDAEQSLRDSANQKWLIDGVVPSGAFGILYGPSGSYKSFLALDMCIAVTTGQNWHGFDVDNPGPVLYIAAEGQNGLKERAVGWTRHYERDYGPLVILPVAIMMDSAVHVQQFVEACLEAQQKVGKPFSMVVIDTMARSFNGDENSSQEVGVFINNCSAWASKLGGCTVMVVTHAGKDLTRGIRGSSAIKGASDFVFVVTRPNHLQALLKNEKQKDIDEADDMRFALSPVDLGIDDHKGRPRKSLVPILESKGRSADPEGDDDFEDSFRAKDKNEVVRVVRASVINGKPITEDDLRSAFIGQRIAEGGKPDAARKAFARSYDRARQDGLIMKHGKFVSMVEGQ